MYAGYGKKMWLPILVRSITAALILRIVAIAACMFENGDSSVHFARMYYAFANTSTGYRPASEQVASGCPDFSRSRRLVLAVADTQISDAVANLSILAYNCQVTEPRTWLYDFFGASHD